METFLAISRCAYLSKKIWEDGVETIPFRELMIIGVIDKGIRTKAGISKRLMRDKSSISREIDDLQKRDFLYKENKKYYLTKLSIDTLERSEENKREIASKIFPDTTPESRDEFLKKLLTLEEGLLKYLTGKGN